MKYLTPAALVAVFTGFTGLSPLRAQEPQTAVLTVGSPAPALKTGAWVQGEPVKDFEPAKAYIVEFWATWCGPCRTSIPHLNEIHKKFESKGLVVIGQDCWERDATKVPGFLREMGDKMTYRVALDNLEGSEKGHMAETWMQAAGQNGIPSAFLVGKDRRLAWIGHPMELKEETIELVLAGKYDVDKAAKEFAEKQGKEQKFNMAMQKVTKALQAKNWDAASGAVEELTPLAQDEQKYLPVIMKQQIAAGRGDLAQTVALGEQLAKDFPDNAQILHNAAGNILDTAKTDKTALETADKIAAQALTALGEKPNAQGQIMITATQARIKKALGQDAEALRLATEAVGKADGRLKTMIQERLKEILPAETADTPEKPAAPAETAPKQ